jgi:hypothetical protein
MMKGEMQYSLEISVDFEMQGFFDLAFEWCSF